MAYFFLKVYGLRKIHKRSGAEAKGKSVPITIKVKIGERQARNMGPTCFDTRSEDICGPFHCFVCRWLLETELAAAFGATARKARALSAKDLLNPSARAAILLQRTRSTEQLNFLNTRSAPSAKFYGGDRIWNLDPGLLFISGFDSNFLQIGGKCQTVKMTLSSLKVCSIHFKTVLTNRSAHRIIDIHLVEPV